MSKGPPKAKAATYQSAYGNTNNATFGSDFGTGTSSIDPHTGQLTTISSLTPQLKSVADQAGQGLGASLGYLNQNPQTTFGNMQAGNDPYYNVLQQNNARILQDQQSQAALYGQQTGMQNSTTLGSEMGRIHNDDNLRQQQNLATAMQFGNDQARQNASTQLGSISGLANLSYPLGSAANSNLTTGLGARDAAAQSNAAAQTQVNLANQQAQIARQQAQSGMVGNLINGAATLGGFALGGPLGSMAGGALSRYATGALGLGNTASGLGGGSGISLPRTTFGSQLV